MFDASRFSLVSSLLALAARCRRVARRARSGGGSHDDLALGATLRPRTDFLLSALRDADAAAAGKERAEEMLNALLGLTEKTSIRSLGQCQWILKQGL
jgi:hypothetical protein